MLHTRSSFRGSVVLVLHYHGCGAFYTFCQVDGWGTLGISFWQLGLLRVRAGSGQLLRYFLNDFEMISVAPTITGINFVYIFYTRCLLLLLLSLSLSLSPLCRVFIHIFLRQTMSLGNTAFQLFCHYYLWCLYR